MYLTDYRENTLKDVITKLEPDLFKTVTGLTVDDFNLLVSLNVFNSAHMNQAVFAFRRYEDASLSYTGVESHEGLRHYGLYDTVDRQGGVVTPGIPTPAASRVAASSCDPRTHCHTPMRRWGPCTIGDDQHTTRAAAAERWPGVKWTVVSSRSTPHEPGLR